MRLITPDCGWHIWHQGKRYRELPAKEVRELPENTTVLSRQQTPQEKYNPWKNIPWDIGFRAPFSLKCLFGIIFSISGNMLGENILF